MNFPHQITGKDVVRLINARKLGDAERLAKDYLRINVANADAQSALSRVYVARQERGRAIQHAEAAHRLDPQNVEHAFLLGRLYLDLDLYEFAYPLLTNVLMRYPTSFQINLAMGDYYLSIGKGAVARPYFERAVTKAPPGDQKRLAIFNMAECLVAEGRGLDAELALMPLRNDQQIGSSVVALLSVIGRKTVESSLGQEIIHKLKVANLDNESRSDLLVALGRLYENSRQWDEAFKNWSNARKLLGVKLFSEADLRKRQSNWTTFFSRTLLQAAKPFGHTSGVPTFIVGMPRSATTLTEQIVSAHSKAYGVGELNRMSKLSAAMARDYEGADHVTRIAENAKKGELKARADETLLLYRTIAPKDKELIVEKTPFNFEALGYINLCFPNAKFIHTRRHPADNFISAFQNRMNRSHDYSYDQVTYVQRYLLQEELMDYWKSIFPEQIFTLQYEKLVAEPESTVRALLAFLGLEWEPQCLKFFERQTTVRTFSTEQVRSAIYTSSVERWRNYEKHLGPLFQALKDANFEYK
jgi:tetratricopeptide (TPR) repeat protein